MAPSHRDGCALFPVAEQKDPPPLGSRFLEAWCPVGVEVSGTLPARSPSGLRLDVDLLVEGFPENLWTAPKCLSRACAMRCTEMYPRFVAQAWFLTQLPSRVKFTTCHRTPSSPPAANRRCWRQKRRDQFPFPPSIPISYCPPSYSRILILPSFRYGATEQKTRTPQSQPWDTVQESSPCLPLPF